MSIFAIIEGTTVVNVIVADQAFMDEHLPEVKSVEVPLGAQVGVGSFYDSDAGSFRVSETGPYPSWIYNPVTNSYEPPSAAPADSEGGYYTWNEGTLSWDWNDPSLLTLSSPFNFNVVYPYSRVGNPDNVVGYDPAIHGDRIWPFNKGQNSTGWVGATFTPSTSSVQITGAVDDNVQIYFDSELVTTFGTANTIFNDVVAVTPGRTYALSARVQDTGGLFTFCCTVRENNGVILRTSTSWVSG